MRVGIVNNNSILEYSLRQNIAFQSKLGDSASIIKKGKDVAEGRLIMTPDQVKDLIKQLLEVIETNNV